MRVLKGAGPGTASMSCWMTRPSAMASNRRGWRSPSRKRWRSPAISMPLGFLNWKSAFRAWATKSRRASAPSPRPDCNARLLVWCRMRTTTCRACRELGVHMVDLSIPVSDQQIRHKLGGDRRTGCYGQIAPPCSRAHRQGWKCAWAARTRRGPTSDFLLRVIEAAEAAGRPAVSFRRHRRHPRTVSHPSGHLPGCGEPPDWNWRCMPTTTWAWQPPTAWPRSSRGPRTSTPRSTGLASARATLRSKRSPSASSCLHGHRNRRRFPQLPDISMRAHGFRAPGVLAEKPGRRRRLHPRGRHSRRRPAEGRLNYQGVDPALLGASTASCWASIPAAVPSPTP